MHSTSLCALFLAAGLTFAASAAAAPSLTPTQLCGGEHDHKKKKDVKKPAPEHNKPTNPPRHSGLPPN